MKLNEKSSPQPLACFKLDKLPYFHTGDLKRCIIPDTNDDFNESTYGRIRFHLFLKMKTTDSYLLSKRVSTESTFSTLIEYATPFTYEYAELYTLTKFTEQFFLPVVDIRFLKMELISNHQDASELHYYLIGLVNENKIEIAESNFNLVSESYIRSHVEETSIWFDVVNAKHLYVSLLHPEKKTGLIIGRFQPVHLGHIYLFKKSLEEVDCLIIGIGSSQIHNEPKNPFTYEERKNLIELALKEENVPSSRFKIYPIPDKFNFHKWKESIFNIVEEFDVLFTNNLWIGRLIQQRGKSLVYGLKYKFTQYNGTHIRKMLLSRNSDWKTLVPQSSIPFLESWIKTR